MIWVFLLCKNQLKLCRWKTRSSCGTCLCDKDYPTVSTEFLWSLFQATELMVIPIPFLCGCLVQMFLKGQDFLLLWRSLLCEPSARKLPYAVRCCDANVLTVMRAPHAIWYYSSQNSGSSVHLSKTLVPVADKQQHGSPAGKLIQPIIVAYGAGSLYLLNRCSVVVGDVPRAISQAR